MTPRKPQMLTPTTHLEIVGRTYPREDELAERVKALKTANAIEVAPQRACEKHSTVEEPITARIRWRHTKQLNCPKIAKQLTKCRDRSSDCH